MLAAKYGSGTIYVAGGPTSVDYAANGDLTGGADGAFYWRVQWTGTAAGTDWALLSANSGGLTGATVSVDPYRDGQTITGRVTPHGGYSATTDYCLQCHSVHNATDEYSLLASASVTATCQTCHAVGGVAPSGAIDPGMPGVEAPVSLRSAYEVTGGARRSGHAIGANLSSAVFASSANAITESGWAYGGFDPNGSTTHPWSSSEPAGAGTASAGGGGLYCGDCHTPHGDFGQLVNSKYYRSSALPGTTNGGSTDLSVVQTWEENAPYTISGYQVRYLHFDAVNKVWQGCTAVNGGGTCTNLTATDTEGESAYLYGYKLLSAYPNHSWNEGAVSWGMESYGHDGAQWCGRCHDLATPSQYGGTVHSHPTGCTSCHGNPNDATSTDFPHTSTFQSLLKDYPDLLCINCHSAGSLP
ncbi:MAG: cytochrome c3 family protein [Planctomycetaceae bacterium]